MINEPTGEEIVKALEKKRVDNAIHVLCVLSQKRKWTREDLEAWRDAKKEASPARVIGI